MDIGDMAVSVDWLQSVSPMKMFLQWLAIFVTTMLVFKLGLFAWRFEKLKRAMRHLPGLQRKFLLGNIWEARVAYFKDVPFPNNVFILNFLSALGLGFGAEGMASGWLGFRPAVLLLRAHTVEPLLSSNVALDKSYEYGFLHKWLGTGLLTSTGKKWKSRRKMLTPSFHFRILEEFQPIISENSQVLIQILKELPNLYCPDMMELITLCTLDIIGETALGVNISAQTNKESAYVKALSVLGRMFMLRALRPWLWNDFIFSLTPTGRKSTKSLKILHSFTANVIRERKDLYRKNPDGDNRRLAFLDLLLQEHFKDGSFTEKDIQEEVDTFTFEGHDTTATGVTWCLYLLGLHQDVQQKVYEELLNIFGNEKDTPVNNGHLKDMKYLDCVIKETLRLYPPVPIIARELKEDLIVDGKLIPASAACYVSVPDLHRDPAYFPNPEFFEPDRFLSENCAGRHPYAYIPFSAGPRNCIGQKFAQNEEKTLVANVVRNFKLKSLDYRDKVLVCPELVSRPIPGIRMQLEKRN